MNILLKTKTRVLHWSEISTVPYEKECLTIGDKFEPMEKKNKKSKSNERLYDQQIFKRKC